MIFSFDLYLSSEINLLESDSIAVLTKKSVFDLNLPRVYFCSLKMFIRSDNHFNVRIELLDETEEDQYSYNESEDKTKPKSTHNQQVYQDRNVSNNFQGENFPIKGIYFF